ncbi:MAG: hypothetical protein AAFP69_24185, partial [Planctomycetota bacterium]
KRLIRSKHPTEGARSGGGRETVRFSAGSMEVLTILVNAGNHFVQHVSKPWFGFPRFPTKMG